MLPYGSRTTMSRMRVFVLLLYVFLMAAPDCTGFTTPTHYITKSIRGIRAIVSITQVHIDKLSTKLNLQVDPEIHLSPPSIQGLSSIVQDLGLLDNGLRSSFTELLSQIQTDVSSLEGAVHTLASSKGCNIHVKPPVPTREHPFLHTYQRLMLRKVKHYMDHLLLNMDKLYVC